MYLFNLSLPEPQIKELDFFFHDSTSFPFQCTRKHNIFSILCEWNSALSLGRFSFHSCALFFYQWPPSQLQVFLRRGRIHQRPCSCAPQSESPRNLAHIEKQAHSRLGYYISSIQIPKEIIFFKKELPSKQKYEAMFRYQKLQLTPINTTGTNKKDTASWNFCNFTSLAICVI